MSLIDTVITVAMTAVALTISVPQFQTLRGPFQASAASHQVVAALEGARLRAIARNTRYRVNFAAQGSTYTVEREAAPNSFVADGGTKILPAGVSAATSALPIFDTRGMLPAAVTVTLTACAAPTKTITLNALGQVSTQ